MGGGNHNARVAAEVSRGKREHGNRHKGFVKENLKARSGKNARSSLCEKCGIIAAVVSEGNFNLARIFFLKIVCKTEGCFADGVFIHTV